MLKALEEDEEEMKASCKGVHIDLTECTSGCAKQLYCPVAP